MTTLTDCPTGCGRKQQPGKLLCYPCWREVPAHIQRDVYRTWRALQRERAQRPRDMDAWGEALAQYEAAREAAIGSIR